MSARRQGVIGGMVWCRSCLRRCRCGGRPASSQRHPHLRRRSRLWRRIVVRRHTAEDSEHRSPRARRHPVHRRACRCGDLHAIALRPTHRTVRLAPSWNRRAARKRGAHHRTRPSDAPRCLQAGRLRDGCRRQVAPWARTCGRTGLERRDSPWTARHRLRFGVHHGRHRRSRADGLRGEPTRCRPRSCRSDCRQLRHAAGRVADGPGKSEPAQGPPEPRSRPDDRQWHQPDRLHDRREGRAVEGRGHGGCVYTQGRGVRRTAPGEAVLPVLRPPRSARAARAASAVRRCDVDGRAR